MRKNWTLNSKIYMLKKPVQQLLSVETPNQTENYMYW